MIVSKSQRERVERLFSLTRSDRTRVGRIKLLGRGNQSEVIACYGRKNRFLWRDQNKVAVKLFHPSSEKDHDGVEAELTALSILRDHVNGLQVHGWTIHTPLPLFRSNEPSAIVSTVVPGKQLVRSIGQKPTEIVRESLLFKALAAAVRTYWERSGQIYGDFTLKNILCDFTDRRLSLVDPGAPRRIYSCEGISADWFPASRDLAYLLFDTAAQVRSFLLRPYLSRRRLALAASIVRYCLAGHPEDQLALLDEASQCAGIHLRRIHGTGVVGAWRSYVRHQAAQNIEAMLEQLRAEVTATSSNSAVSDGV